MEAETDRAEDQAGAASEDIQAFHLDQGIEARDYSEEQSVTVHPEGVRDEKADDEPSNVAETKEVALEDFPKENEENSENLGITPAKSGQETSTYEESMICATYNNDELQSKNDTISSSLKEEDVPAQEGIAATPHESTFRSENIVDESRENEENQPTILEDTATSRSEPKVTEKIEEISLIRADGSGTELDEPLEKDSEKLQLTEESTEGTDNGTESVIIDNDLRKAELIENEAREYELEEMTVESLHMDTDITTVSHSTQENITTSCPEEQSTNVNLHGIGSGDSEEKTIDADDVQKDVSESFSATVSNSPDEGSINPVLQGAASDPADIKATKEVDTQEKVHENFPITVSNEEIEDKLMINESESETKIEARETNDDEQAVIHEAGIEDRGLTNEQCESEKITNNISLKMESEIDKAEDQTGVASEDIQAFPLDQVIEARDYSEEQSVTEHPQGVLDEKTDDETSNVAETKEAALEVEDFSRETEENSENKVDGSETKNEDTLKNQREETSLHEAQIEDGKLTKDEFCENEKSTDSTLLKIEPEIEKPEDSMDGALESKTEKPKDSMDAVSEEIQDLRQDIETKEEIPEIQDVQTIISNEDTEDKSLTQVDHPQTKNEEHLENDSELPSFTKQASTEDACDDKSTIVDGRIGEVELLGSEENIDSTLVKKENLDIAPEDHKESASSEDTERTVIPQTIINGIGTKEDVEENTGVQVAGSRLDHEEHPEKESEKSENSSSTEAPMGTPNDSDSKCMDETKDRNDGIIKDELLENEESKISTFEKEEEEVEKAIDSLQAASEDIKELDSSQDTNISSIEENTQQEISSDHTEVKTTDAPDANQETIEDVATNISDGDNVDNSPIEEDGSQIPSLEEASPEKASNDEPTIVHEAKFVDERSRDELHENDEEVRIESSQVAGEDIKAYASGDDRETRSQEEQSLSTDPQGIKEEKTCGTIDTEEEIPEYKNDATVSPCEVTEESTIIQVDSSHELKQNEILEKESENTSITEALAGDTSESNLVREEAQVDKHVDSSQVATEDIEASASSQEMETSCAQEQNLTAYPPETSSDKIEREIIDATYVKETTFEEASAINDDERTIIQEDKHADESSIKAESLENERSIEYNVVKEEESAESLQVVDEDFKAPSDQKGETSFVEEQCEIADPQGTVGDQKVEETTDATDLKEVKSEDKINDLGNVATPIPHDDTEASLQVAIEEIERSTPSEETETTSVKEQIVTVDPQEISCDKTDEENIGATETKEEDLQVQDIGTNAQDRENEENSPIEAYHESAITLEDKLVDEGLIKPEPVENEKSAEGTNGNEEISTEIEAEDTKASGLSEDRGTSSLEEQSLSVNPQRILADNEEEKTIDPTELKEETSKNKVPEETDIVDIKAKDIELNEEDNCLEDPQTAAEVNVAAHEENSSNSITPDIKTLDVDKDIESSVKEMSEEHTKIGDENVAEVTSVESEESESHNVVAEETKCVLDDGSITTPTNENLVETDVYDGSITIPTNENLIETDAKESTESELQATNEEKESELVQQVPEAGTDQNKAEKELLIDASRDVSESNEVSRDVSESNEVKAEGEKRDSLTEEIENNVQLCLESSNGSEITQETQKPEEALLPALDNTDSTEREFAVDASKTEFIEHPEEDDTTGNLLDENKPTENEKGETECRQEKALLDETVEEIKQSSSIPEANDFPPKSFIETSDVDHSNTEAQQVETTSKVEITDLISPEEKINELENVSTPIPHEDTEANVLTEADCSQMEQKEYLQKQSENSSSIEVPAGETTEGDLLKEEAQKEKPTDSFQVAVEDIKASDPSQDTETSSVKERILTADPQEISGDKTKEENIDATDTKEEHFQVQDIGTNVPNGDNEENSSIEVDDSQKLSPKEACHESEIVEESLTKAEQFEEDKTIDTTELKEETSEDKVPEKIEHTDIKAKDIDLNEEDNHLDDNVAKVVSLESEESESVCDQSGVAEENKSAVDGGSITIQPKESQVQTDPKESTESESQAPNVEKEAESVHQVPEEETDLNGTAKELNINDSQDVSKSNEVNAEEEKRDSNNCEEISDSSTSAALEEAPPSNLASEKDSSITESKIENTDHTEREFVEDAIKTEFIEHSEEDDTTENLLDEKKPTENEEEETECRQEKTLLDETLEENIKQSTSIPVANDFPPKSFTETAEVGHSTTEGQHVESRSIEETSDLIARCERDEYEHAIEEKMDSTEHQFTPEENKSEYESSTHLLESIPQIQTCDQVSKEEEPKVDEENLEVAEASEKAVTADIFEAKETRNVAIPSEKFNEEDEKDEDYLGSSKEVVTETSLKDQVPKFSEEAYDEAVEKPEDNYTLANDTIDRGLQQDKSIEEVDISSHTGDTSAVSHSDGVQDIPEDSKISTNKDESSNDCPGSQVSTFSKGIELTEQASKATTITDEMPELNAGSDCGAVPEAVVVDNENTVDEISVVSKGIAETSASIEPIPLSTAKSNTEAKDEKSEPHDLFQESNARDSEVKEAQKDEPVNLQNAVDACDDSQELNEASAEISSKEKAVEADPNQNIVTFSSEEQEAEAQQLGTTSEAAKGVNCDEIKTTDDKCDGEIENACQEAAEKVSESKIDQIITEDTPQSDTYETSPRQIDSLPIPPHCSTELEVTLLPSKDNHVVPEADYTGNMIPENSSDKQHISAIQHEESIECSESKDEILKPSELKPEEANRAHEETAKSGEKSESKETDKSSLSDFFHVSAETKPTMHKEGLHGEKVDECEHDQAKTDEEKHDEDESSEQRLELASEAPVMVDMGDAEVKSAHKKSHNILSGVGSKVKHSIAKVKKVITGKSSHPKPSSPK